MHHKLVMAKYNSIFKANNFTWSIFILLLCCNSAKCLAQSDAFKAPERGFTSWQPAANWEHAMLSGNGTMGAMVIGQPHNETILLSHSDLYIPLDEPKPTINQASRLAEIRKLLLEGKGTEAAKIPVEQRNKENFTKVRDPFIPAFDVLIEQEPSNVKRYQRSVDFTKGEAKVSWEDGIGVFERKVFVSRPDSVIVLSIKGSSKINCSLQFDSRPVDWNQWWLVKEMGERTASAEGTWLTYRSSFKNRYKGGLQGYEGAGRVVLKGGTSNVSGNKILISDADEVLLYIKIKPSYNYSNSQINQLQTELSRISSDYSGLLARHAKVHGELFNKTRLSLNSSENHRLLHTEEILQAAKSKVPAALIEKVFDTGRYNIISSTGTNPPNLQGIWTGTWTAPWSADFTHDGNLPTAISSILSSSMPELMKAYFNYHDKLLPTYRENAKNLYGTRGIHIPVHSTNTGWDINFGDVWCLSFWTGAAGWAAHYYYDYYQYTGDTKFLKERAYPFMKEAALFYEDFLTLDKQGKYLFNPSYSPENNPLNNPSQAVINATMDVMIAKQLLRNCIAAAKVLKDNSKVKSWEQMLAKMPAYQIAKDGTIREWLQDGLEENHKHRHTSQLYALYDVVDPDFSNNPQLLKAVNRTIDEKMKFRISEGGGEMAFGLVQLGLSAAHIGEADKSRQIVEWLSSKYWSTALGSFHNVGGLFNTDISGGLPALIIEMLVYSEPGKVSLLPALPKEWNKGSIEGISLRNQLALNSLKWEGKSIELSLKSTKSQIVQLSFPGIIKSLEGYKTTKLSNNTVGISIPANKNITLNIQLD